MNYKEEALHLIYMVDYDKGKECDASVYGIEYVDECGGTDLINQIADYLEHEI